MSLRCCSQLWLDERLRSSNASPSYHRLAQSFVFTATIRVQKCKRFVQLLQNQQKLPIKLLFSGAVPHFYILAGFMSVGGWKAGTPPHPSAQPGSYLLTLFSALFCSFFSFLVTKSSSILLLSSCPPASSVLFLISSRLPPSFLFSSFHPLPLHKHFPLLSSPSSCLLILSFYPHFPPISAPFIALNDVQRIHQPH